MPSKLYEAFSADYDILQGHLAEACWEAGILRDLVRHGRTCGNVFDAAAGTGVGARKLKEIGSFQITSCDQSAAMLSRAERFSTTVLQANLATLPTLSVRYDLVLSGFDALNYLTPGELGAFLAWTHAHMADDGLLVFDYSSPTLLRDEWRSREYVDRKGSLTLRRRHSYDSDDDRAVIELTCLKCGRERWRETHYQYSITAAEMTALAEGTQLTVKGVRNIEDDSYSSNTHTHVYVMSKQISWV